MQLSYDYWLLLISVITACVSLYITMGFISHLYLSTNAAKKMLLPIFSLAVGGGIWANHFLVSISIHADNHFRSPLMALLGLVFATIIGFALLTVASKNNARLPHFIICGLISGLSDFGLFYCSNAAFNGLENISHHSLMTVVSIGMSISLVSLITLLMYWIKSYAGKHQYLVKLTLSLVIALSIVSIHFVYSNAISRTMDIAIASNLQLNRQITGITIALGMICLFMMLFIFTLFYEKYGKDLFIFNSFSFSFLSRLKDAEPSLQNAIDSLTKLPNRRAFELQLKSAAKRSTRAGTSFALAYIDLDHFKPINDQHGHHIGDVVLLKTAQRLNTAVRGCDFVARIGGDEFVAIIEDIKSNDDITPIAERIVKSIKETFAINQLKIEISCSVGIAIFPKDGDTEKLMVCADAAMYKAKEGGRDQFRFYDAAIETASDQLLELQSELCVAIEKSEFVLAYQPKIDCKTQAPVGVEALIRWNHPTKGEILPHTFLAAAERFGLINEINNWVVDECCRTITQAKKMGIQLNIAINLSSHQFRNPNLIKDILKTLKFYDLSAESLSFEIKETIAINNQEQFKLMLQKFEEAGIKVALDDFGLHPISLAYLQELNVSEIKLDRSFIADITHNKNSKSLIDAVIKLAHALDLHVVAEGVETEAQRDTVTELGCDYMQGFLFAKPVTVDALFALYQTLQINQIQPKADTPSKFNAADHDIITA